MEKGIDQEREREREIDKGTIIDGFTWDFTHTPKTWHRYNCQTTIEDLMQSIPWHGWYLPTSTHSMVFCIQFCDGAELVIIHKMI